MRGVVSFCLLATVFAAVSAKMQNVTVTGITVCHKKRQANVKVELWDRDTLDPNDLLSTIYTNSDGEFTITGGEDEVGKIEPFIRISHSCNAQKGCQRVGDYVVPQEKIGSNYDMTYVTLDMTVTGEKEYCA